MTTHPDNFAYMNTGFQPKLNTINRQIRLVNFHLNNPKFNGLAVGIPGAGLQCSRHVTEYNDYGVKEENQIMVDYSQKVHDTHKLWKNTVNFTGHIKKGNIIDIVNDCWKNGQQVDVIDFDDVAHLHYGHEKLIIDAYNNDVKVFILVVTNRLHAFSDYHIASASRFNINLQHYTRREWRQNMLGVQLGTIEGICKLTGYSLVDVIRYPGKDMEIGRAHV